VEQFKLMHDSSVTSVDDNRPPDPGFRPGDRDVWVRLSRVWSGTIGIEAAESGHGALRGWTAEAALTHVACLTLAESLPIHGIRINGRPGRLSYNFQ
jgi:hypothetical protein